MMNMFADQYEDESLKRTKTSFNKRILFVLFQPKITAITNVSIFKWKHDSHLVGWSDYVIYDLTNILSFFLLSRRRDFR